VPTIAFRGGSLGSSIPGTISWPAAADTVAYRLQLQVDNGAWRDVPIPTPTATSLATTFLVGHSYRVRLGNKLAAGVWSAWAYSAAIPVGLYEETASQIAYAGSWMRVARSGASGGYVRLATSSTAVATATFRARAFAWIAPLGPTLGSATIYLDGALVGSVDLYRASASTRRIVYVASWPTSRRHVLEIHVSGTTGHPEIDLDAIAVAG
jgi:hypothetical protein